MVAEKIKELRENKNLTQSQLAQQLGITRSGVNAWEMGISVPSTQYIVELANLFSVSTDFILGVEKTSTLDISDLTPEDVKIVHALVEHLKKIHKN